MDLEVYPREWIQSKNAPLTSCSDWFSVVTYNILTDSYAHSGGYHYVPEGRRYLSTTRHAHIMMEIRAMNPHIVCFQEVEEPHWTTRLQPDMMKAGYKGIHFAPENSCGQAVCYRTDDFNALRHKIVVLQEQDIQGEAHGLSQEEKEAITELLDAPRSAILLHLQHISTRKELYIVNIHVSWDKLEKPQVQITEITKTLKMLTEFMGDSDKAYIMVGDFNTPPTYPAYQLLSEGQLKPDMVIKMKELSNVEKHGELNRALIDKLPSLFQHSLKFTSAYLAVMGEEPEITNSDDTDLGYRGEFCLDYIWFNDTNLDVTGVLKTPPREAIIRHHALPSVLFPSDHLPLQAEFQFRT